MKRYNLLMILVMAVFAAGAALADLAFLRGNVYGDKLYNVEVNRLINKYSAVGEITEADLSSCRHIKSMDVLSSVSPVSPSDRQRFFDGSGYLVRPLYYDSQFIGDAKFYYIEDNEPMRAFLLRQNAVFLLLFAFVMMLLLYLRYTVIRPLHILKAFPETLAKGDLITPLQEHNSHFFRQFLWGLDMLRETLLSERRRVLAVEKEKAQTALSLSHEIKTPLGAIMLSAQVLREGLFQDTEERNEMIGIIDKRARDIQSLVIRLQAGISEAIPDLPVKDGVFYLDEMIKRTDEAYRWRMKVTRTQFKIEPYTDCQLKGDADRAFEALCNLLENCMKYGDGRHISIGFTQEEGCRLVTVANSGNSLLPEESAHIFKSFWRGSNALGKPGNGLGLYVVRRLCVLMGGDAFASPDGDQMRITLVFRMR
ncbi:MAG: HAMP domain-containing histidine kinase [Peptococcaceae bacterium]|nr:HAMP domain-containing histidine kinase [Peptococcaceae bacterium]